MADDADMCEDDAEALKVRRADLYAFMQELTAAAAMLPAPENYLEAERAVRAITTADRFIQTLDLPDTPENVTPETPTPAGPTPALMRKALRQLADRMMAAVKRIPMPDSAITVGRALRYARACERMLTQLYTAPKPQKVVTAPPPSVKRSPEEIRAYYKQIERELWEKFSPSPEAKAMRAAKQHAAQTAYEAEMAELAAPLNPCPDKSEGQASRNIDQTPDPP